MAFHFHVIALKKSWIVRELNWLIIEVLFFITHAAVEQWPDPCSSNWCYGIEPVTLKSDKAEF